MKIILGKGLEWLEDWEIPSCPRCSSLDFAVTKKMKAGQAQGFCKCGASFSFNSKGEVSILAERVLGITFDKQVLVI